MFIDAAADAPVGASRPVRGGVPEGALGDDRPTRGESGPRDDSRTRDRVLADVMRLGPVTAVVLAERLSLTPTAVRRHLESLTDSGDIAPTEASARPTGRRGRGRPARAYVVTPAGHRRLDSDSADVARQALRFLARTVGDDAVADFARERFAELELRYAPRIAAAGDDLQSRVDALAHALSADGFAATTRPIGMPRAPQGVDTDGTPDAPDAAAAPREQLLGVQLCQGHCPMHSVAAEFPQLCEAETATFARLLGVHVQRLATLSGGEHVCTTYVPACAPPGPPGAAPATDSRPTPGRTPDQSHPTNEERTPR